MDWYTFCLGMQLLVHEGIRAIMWLIVTEVIPARWFQLAQVAPKMPDITAAFDRHGTIGILFWIIAVLGAVVLALVGCIVLLYKKEDQWIKTLESYLKEHFAQKEELRELKEELKITNANYKQLLERIAWQRGDGR